MLFGIEEYLIIFYFHFLYSTYVYFLGVGETVYSIVWQYCFDKSIFPSMANASNLSAALSMHCIVAATCFLRSDSCLPMVFDACAWTLSAYSSASFTVSCF